MHFLTIAHFPYFSQIEQKNETKCILVLQKDINLKLFFSQQDISKLIISYMNSIEPPLLILVSCPVPLD